MNSETLTSCGSSQTFAHSTAPVWKRALDIALVLAASIIWAPLCVLIALFIKAVSPGPVLFRQERVGLMGRRFCCLKFRTMHFNADSGIHQQHLNRIVTANEPLKKLDAADPRIIPGGLWIRSLGLDELPQLINVLRGDMSLVGPRPCVPYEYEMFLPHHRRRCETLPGLTGLWQVNGKNRTTFDRMMELDAAYVDTKSLLLDLKIIVLTLPAVLIQVWDVKMARRAGLKALPVTATPVSKDTAPLERLLRLVRRGGFAGLS
jgi:lipopolysaccharide/colanic/teichoic acid biosynthesis glycosyltransferase